MCGYGVTVASIDLKSIAERRAGSTPAIRTTVFSPGDVMEAMIDLGSIAERRGSSSLPWGTIQVRLKCQNQK